MKISFRWLCDHIEGVTWSSVDVQKMVADFNTKVAEIEDVETVSVSANSFFAGRVVSIQSTTITLLVPEWGCSVEVPVRSDIAIPCHPLAAYLLKKENDVVSFVSLKDLGLDKQGLLPAVAITDEAISGAWRAEWEADDIIFDVDNKSLTHRPDMWGHHGFAREVAMLLSATPMSDSAYLSQDTVTWHTQSVNQSVKISIDAEGCSAFSAAMMPSVVSAPSNVRAVSRFIKIGYRPINAIVDATNYVMADWGRPMHAYDACEVAHHTLAVRNAVDGEQLELLDGASITLTSHDMVIADDEKVLALAGIMGGAHSGVSEKSSALLLEAACFHAATVRRSATRHKVRTESSQRFEKTLDTTTTPEALLRFIQIAREWGIVSDGSYSITVVGSKPAPTVIEMSETYLQNRIGCVVSHEQISDILLRLGFGVKSVLRDNGYEYHITVPAWRAAKDVTAAHDIVEEIARHFGFENIPTRMPLIPARAASLRPVMVVRALKEHLAYAAHMREQRNYAFYDEPVLQRLQWPIADDALALKNPVSQQARCLVTNLLPHLFNNVMENSADYDSAAFFEWGTVWGGEPTDERYQLAGVWFDSKGALDFYTLKDVVVSLCARAEAVVSFEKAVAHDQPWLLAEKGARIMHEQQCIGYFGQVNPLMVSRMGLLPESILYAFTIDGTYLQNITPPIFNVGAVRKHQHSTFDVSVLIPASLTVATLEAAIQKISESIVNVRLIDFFEKKEWTDRRSVTLRATLAHADRTVSRDELEQVRQQVIEMITSQGGQLRA